MSSSQTEILIGSLVKEENPAISIIVPNYNTARYISETLDSVFAQTFEDFEVIVLNDAAPDTAELKHVLSPFLQKITFIDKTVNSGTSVTRNLGAEHARGEILAFLDADDIWRPTFLEELHKFLTQNNYDMAYADAEIFGENRAPGQTFLQNNPREGNVTRELLIGGKCQILPSGTLIKKSEFLAVGGFDPKVKRTEDFDLWMRLIFRGMRIGYLRKVLFKFRISPASGSGDLLQRIERCIDLWHALRAKLPFTDEENKIIDRHIENEEASLLRAQGRVYLEEGNWNEAKKVFSSAYKKARALKLPLKHRLKMLGVLFLLSVSPKLLRKLSRNLRSEEFDYMPHKQLTIDN